MRGDNLQTQFMAFAASPAGLELTDLESKTLLAFYSAANPETGEVSLPISKIKRALGLPAQEVATAADSLTAKGFLVTIKPSEKIEKSENADGGATIAVRKLCFNSKHT